MALLALAALLAALLAAAPGAAAIPAQIPSPVSLRLTAQGPVWTDSGDLRQLSPDGSVVALAGGIVQPSVFGSDGWVAVDGSTGVAAGPPAGPILHVPSGPSVGAGDCSAWQANTAQEQASAPPLAYPIANGSNLGTGSRSAPFAVAGRELFLAGSPVCVDATPSGPRPVFVRRLRGGGWRVWRRFEVGNRLVLAARGHWLAIGIPTATALMTVRVFDLRKDSQRYAVTGLPAGDLVLDEAGRLLVAAPAYPRAFPVPDPGLSFGVAYQVFWATPAAPRAHRLSANAMGVPAISNGRVAYISGDIRVPGSLVGNGQALGSGTLEVRDLHSGATRAIIGLNEPLRQIHAFDLRGSGLVWMQSESPPPDPDACFAQTRQSARHLEGIDLNTATPFVPAPPSPPRADPATSLARCGPPPP